MFRITGKKHLSGEVRWTGRQRIKSMKVFLPIVVLGVVVVVGVSICLSVSVRAKQTVAPVPAVVPAPAQEPVQTPKPQKTARSQPTVQETEPVSAVDELEPPVPEEPVEEDTEELLSEVEPQESKPLFVFSQESLDERIEKIVGSIITDGMTKREQAYAIFKYVYSHVRYVGTGIKTSWQEGAFEGLTTGRGDCYTYYALSRALLTAAGIDNLEVTRIGGTDSHYWNLVNCGDGWYHFDAGPHTVPMPAGSSFFMFTDAEAAAYTAKAGRNYYDFDGSLYPERAGGVEPEAPLEPVVSTEPETLPEDMPFDEEPQVPVEEDLTDPMLEESDPPASPDEEESAAEPDEPESDEAETPDKEDASAETDVSDEANEPAETDEFEPEEMDTPAVIEIESEDVPGETELPPDETDVSDI